MAKTQRHGEPKQRHAQAHPDRESFTRESGRWGADEPDYGRPPGQRPDPTPQGGPNPHGAQYEEGGQYPGTRRVNEQASAPTPHADTAPDAQRADNHSDPGRGGNTAEAGSERKTAPADKPGRPHKPR